MKKVCKYNAHGKCKFGDRCRDLHIDDSSPSIPREIQPDLTFEDNQNYSQNIQANQTQQTNTQQSNICRFFLQGTCKNDHCRFFHGYGENLQNISKEIAHDKPIVGLCQISEKKFLTADDTCLKIWIIESKFENLSSSNIDEGKITRVIFSNEKIILATQIEQMYGKFKQLNFLKHFTDPGGEKKLFSIGDIFSLYYYI